MLQAPLPTSLLLVLHHRPFPRLLLCVRSVVECALKLWKPRLYPLLAGLTPGNWEEVLRPGHEVFSHENRRSSFHLVKIQRMESSGRHWVRTLIALRLPVSLRRIYSAAMIDAAWKQIRMTKFTLGL